MGKYFKIISVFEFLAFVSSLIWWIVNTATSNYIKMGLSTGVNILILFTLLFFGPATGLLFYAVGNLVDKNNAHHETENILKTIKSSSTDDDCQLLKIGDTVITINDFTSVFNEFTPAGIVGTITQIGDELVEITVRDCVKYKTLKKNVQLHSIDN